MPGGALQVWLVGHHTRLAVPGGEFALVLFGFAAQFIFWSVTFAGEIIGFQMGLSIAAVYNPMDGVASNPIGRVLTLTMLLVFLLLDGHHHMLRALVASFEVVPLSGADLSRGGPLLLQWMGAFFVTAIRLAAPFMITIFLVDVALGVFARVAPQADLFSMGLPLKIVIGLSLTILFMQNFMPILPDLIRQVLGLTWDFLRERGFTDAQWDEMFEMMQSGWRYFFFNLKHYLEHHAGTRRRMVFARVPVPRASSPDDWEAVLRGLGIEGEAVVAVTIDRDGNVRDPEAISATHEEFAQAAVEAMAGKRHRCRRPPGCSRGRRWRATRPASATLRRPGSTRARAPPTGSCRGRPPPPPACRGAGCT